MNCFQVQEYFDEFYSNELNSDTKKIIQEHLDNCSECSKEYSCFTQLKKKAASLKKEITPPKLIFETIEKEIYRKDSQMQNDIKITPLSKNILTIDFFDDKKDANSTKDPGFLFKNWYWLASAAVVLLVVSIVFLSKTSKNIFSAEDMANWKLVSLKGGAFINGVKSDKVSVGDWIQTDSVSSVVLKIANVGDVSIEPNTKVRFIQSDNNVSTIELMYGTVNTSTSQPDKFILQTNNMKVQDKGGSYSFKVDDKGNGVIYVNNGMANVESGDKSAIVTDGKFCLYKPEYGIGIPFRKDSKPEFQNALFQHDFNNGGVQAVYSAIANAMPEDYSSLMNLIPRVDNQTKYLVLNKLGKLVPQVMSTINIDSLDEYDDKDLENSLKGMKENLHNQLKVELNFNKDELARDMEELAKDLANMKIELKIDGKKMAEDMRREMQNLKIELKNMNDLSDTSDMKEFYQDMYNQNFDSEQFKKDMEKMKIELKENLGKMDIELKKNAEEWKKNAEEWKKYGEEWKKNAEEWKKEFSPEKLNLNFNFDSLNIKIEGLEDLEKLKEFENLNDLKIDTANGNHKYYFKFDDKKHKKSKKEKEKLEQQEKKEKKEKADEDDNDTEEI